MATIFQIDYTSPNRPYAAERANAANLSDPFSVEYNQKLVKVVDLVNGLLGTQNRAVLRVNDGTPPATTYLHTSYIHNGAQLTQNNRNATEISAGGIGERSFNGWRTPVFSRALSEHGSASALNTRLGTTIAELQDGNSRVTLLDIQWDQYFDGPGVVRPTVTAWNNVSDRQDLINFLQTQLSGRTILNSISGISGPISRRTFGVTKTVVLLSPSDDVALTDSFIFNDDPKTLRIESYQTDANVDGGIIEHTIFWEGTGFNVINQIFFVPIANVGNGNVGGETANAVILHFVPRVQGGGEAIYEGAFTVRLSNVTFLPPADAKNFLIGGVIGGDDEINWYPRTN